MTKSRKVRATEKYISHNIIVPRRLAVEVERLLAQHQASEMHRAEWHHRLSEPILSAFGLSHDQYDHGYLIGDSEALRARRREMEVVANTLDGLRARLMNASHTIQLHLDRMERKANGKEA